MVRDIIESFLYPDSVPYGDFMLWAFGEDYKNINFNSVDPICAWNKLHKDKLSLSLNRNPEKNLKKMIEVWRKNETQPT